MKIIQDLQGNRPVTARIFDQMTRTLPDGVYFNDVSMTGTRISILGAAESNNRVSELMRKMDGSEWLTGPNLAQVKATTAGAIDQANTFSLTVEQTRPTDAAEGAKP
jgi:type IV pilus assembly protein PilN